MTKNKPVEIGTHFKWAAARIETLAMVACILETELEPSIKLGMELVKGLFEIDARVQGNRPSGSEMTYGDLRLMTIASLKMLVERLENHEENDT